MRDEVLLTVVKLSLYAPYSSNWKVVNKTWEHFKKLGLVHDALRRNHQRDVQRPLDCVDRAVAFTRSIGGGTCYARKQGVTETYSQSSH